MLMFKLIRKIVSCACMRSLYPADVCTQRKCLQSCDGVGGWPRPPSDSLHERCQEGGHKDPRVRCGEESECCCYVRTYTWDTHSLLSLQSIHYTHRRHTCHSHTPGGTAIDDVGIYPWYIPFKTPLLVLLANEITHKEYGQPLLMWCNVTWLRSHTLLVVHAVFRTWMGRYIGIPTGRVSIVKMGWGLHCSHSWHSSDWRSQLL